MDKPTPRQDRCPVCDKYRWDFTQTICLQCRGAGPLHTPKPKPKAKLPKEVPTGLRMARNARQAKEQIKYLESMGRPIPEDLTKLAEKD